MDSFFLGLDIGGTNVRIASYDGSANRISEVKKIAFKKSGNPKVEVDENICELVTDFIKEKMKENKKLGGIGLSLAALFDRTNGSIVIWPNNKVWNGFQLKNYLTERFNVPVLMEDDANAGVLGEHLLGAGKGCANLAYITISTGIGCGLILNNLLYIGSNGWAGELGHVKTDYDEMICTCGMKGCLQALASGPAILKNYNEIKKKNNNRVCEVLDLNKVVSLALKGEKEAIEVFSQAGAQIGKAIANMVMLLDISTVILGGGVIGTGEILMEPIKDTVSIFFGHYKRDINMAISELGGNNGVIGALSLIYKHINGAINVPFKCYRKGK